MCALQAVAGLGPRRPRRAYGERSVAMADKPRQAGGGDAWDATQWHVVQKGETLSKIAQHYYGDASLYPKIFEANRDVLKDPNLIRIGQKLRIP
jgi:nucleoid-associated protein YgaU